MSWPLEMAEKNQRISRVWKKTPTGRGDFTPIVTGRSSPSCGAKKRFVLFLGFVEIWVLGLTRMLSNLKFEDMKKHVGKIQA